MRTHPGPGPGVWINCTVFAKHVQGPEFDSIQVSNKKDKQKQIINYSQITL